MYQKCFSLLATSALTLGVSASSWADTILMDFGFTPIGGTYGTQTIEIGGPDGTWWNTSMYQPVDDDSSRPFDRSSLVTTTGTSSGISITPLTGTYSGGNNGQSSPDAGLGLLAVAQATEDYVGGVTDGTYSFKFGNLSSSNTYDLTLYGARSSGTRYTNFSVLDGVGTQTDEQQVSTSGTANGSSSLIDLTTFTGLTPDTNGEITVFANNAGPNGGSFVYLNAAQLVVNVPEPSTCLLAGLGGLLMFKRRQAT